MLIINTTDRMKAALDTYHKESMIEGIRETEEMGDHVE